LHGHHPYRATTYLGNEITPLPGAILLAIPFYVVASVSLENIFWLGVLLLVTHWFFRSRSTAIIYVLVLLGASAANLDDFVVGGDYIVNAIYVCIALATVMAVHKKNYSVWLQIASEVFLGLAVDSRPVYFVALPLFFAYLLQRRSRQVAIRAVAISGCVAVILPLSLYLYDPAHFAPLHLRHELDFLSPKYHAGLVLGLLGLLVSCIGFVIQLSRRRVYLLMGTALFVMLGLPGVLGWFVFPDALDAWFKLSLATPAALFLLLWLFAKYEKTGYTLRSENKNLAAHSSNNHGIGPASITAS
jgi:hypothetical protein